MTALFPCSGCNRHVNAGASQCPFCGSALSDNHKIAPEPPRGISRSAIIAFGAMIAGSAALGCSDETGGSTTTTTSTATSASGGGGDTTSTTTAGGGQGGSTGKGGAGGEGGSTGKGGGGGAGGGAGGAGGAGGGIVPPYGAPPPIDPAD